ncbi:MAG: hypothetical protein EOP39_08930 [Rubrivivax sp.]|nr:MAG: hypothetical protein EOP39_08930 [Rubrivivax sp.]
MPAVLSSLLQRTRTGLLVVLLVVLPLQGVVQLVVGLQGHRHVHTGMGSALSGLTQPLRALLNQLHAGQEARLLAAPPPSWLVSEGPEVGRHEHGGVSHEHSAQTTDVVDLGDAADEPQQSGATAFLGWMPAALAVPVSEPGVRPATVGVSWRDRFMKPPLAPPRG